MKYLLCITYCFLIIFIGYNIVHYSNDELKWGDWLCFADKINDPTCGTYGWNKDKNIALKTALDLCEKECNAKCEKNYCEKLNNRPKVP